MALTYDLGGNDLIVNTITTGATTTGNVANTAASIAGGSALTLTAALHAGRQINLDTAAGTTITLPAATGTGNKYRFVVTVLATSNSHIVKVANSTDAMQGMIISTLSGTPTTNNTWPAVAGTSDTVTLNRTTTGSVTLGEWFEIQDIASGKFQIFGVTTQSGTAATPFSATV